MEMPQEQYQYSRIRGHEIRLLSWPNDNYTSDDNIELLMSRHHRTRAHRYIALSYEWTREAATHEIRIHGQRFMIRQNLYHALIQLREYSRSWRYLWVDAICIDQSNISKHNEQVQSMDSTFEKASYVVAWLGNNTGLDWANWESRRKHNASGTLYLMKQMDDFYAERMRSATPARFSRGFMKSNRAPYIERDSLTVPRYGHAVKLLELTYWKRRWVVQEIRLAKRLLFLWGTFSFGFNTMRFIVDNCVKRQHGRAKSLTITWELPVWAVVDPSIPFAKSRLTLKPSLPLRELLYTHSDSMCSDPRDRIFALLGVIPKSEQGILTRFFPDYRMNYCLVALITCSYLKQTAWLEMDEEVKPNQKFDLHPRKGFANHYAEAVGVTPEEMLLFFEMSDFCQISHDLASNDGIAWPLKQWRTLSTLPHLTARELKRRWTQRPPKLKDDDIIELLTNISTTF